MKNWKEDESFTSIVIGKAKARVREEIFFLDDDDDSPLTALFRLFMNIYLFIADLFLAFSTNVLFFFFLVGNGDGDGDGIGVCAYPCYFGL